MLETIALHCFGEQTNLLTFLDVKLPNYGTIDFVIARHKPFTREIDDFVPVEVRTFLRTYKFMVGEDVSGHAFPQTPRYEHTIRTFLFQLLERGIIYEAWGVKAYWVIPELVYANMVKRFGFKQDEFSEEHAVRLALQDVATDLDQVTMKATRYISVSVDEIYRAMHNDSGLPDKMQFMAVLNSKLRRTLLSEIRKQVR